MNTQIKYLVADYTDFKVNSAWDALANIVTQLTKLDLTYRHDYEISNVYIQPDGRQVIVLNFMSEETAMLVKLRGVVKANG